MVAPLLMTPNGRACCSNRPARAFSIVNDGDTSWEQVARTCLDEMNAAGLQPRCRSILEVPYADLGPNWSKRPRYSSLDISMLSREFPPGPRPWREALSAFVRAEKSFAER